MYSPQTSLPEREVLKRPKFNMIKVAEVTGNKDFDDKGLLYAKFTKGGRPCPVYMYEHGVRVKPEEGDAIIVGFLESNKTTPFFLGFGQDAYACANFLGLHKDGIAIQFPIDAEDRKEGMSDDAKVDKRAYVRTYKDAVLVNFPMATDGKTVKIKAYKDGAEVVVNNTKLEIKDGEINISGGNINVTGGNVSLAGGTPVARQGDAVEVSVPTIGTCTGTITGGSSTVTAG